MNCLIRCMDEEREKQLIEKVLSGNTKAFGTLVDSYKKLVSHIVYRLVSNIQDREDLCQDVFLKVYQNLEGFQFQSRLSTVGANVERCQIRVRRVHEQGEFPGQLYQRVSGSRSGYGVKRSVGICQSVYHLHAPSFQDYIDPVSSG